MFFPDLFWGVLIFELGSSFGNKTECVNRARAQFIAERENAQMACYRHMFVFEPGRFLARLLHETKGSPTIRMHSIRIQLKTQCWRIPDANRHTVSYRRDDQ